MLKDIQKHMTDEVYMNGRSGTIGLQKRSLRGKVILRRE